MDEDEPWKWKVAVDKRVLLDLGGRRMARHLRIEYPGTGYHVMAWAVASRKYSWMIRTAAGTLAKWKDKKMKKQLAPVQI